MIPDTEKPRSNRAATSFFRIFGGRLRPPAGDAVLLSDVAGLHRGEWRALSLLVPLVLGAAVFDILWRIAGPWAAWAGVLPATFLAAHVVAFVIGGGGPSEQYRRWDTVLLAWSLVQVFWLRDSGVTWAAWLWLAMVVLQGAGALALCWRSLMAIPGSMGIRLRIWLAVLAHVAMILVWIFAGWLAGLACGLLISAVWCRGTLHPASRLYGPVATKVGGQSPLLTIDDGPDPANTPAILDLLDAHGRKAVFFVIGDKVRRFPELAREIVRRGHELGNHTMTHPQSSMWRLGPARTRREIEDCNRTIAEVAGVTPRWFRAPVGHRNFFTHPVTSELGLEVVAWNRRAYDTRDDNVSRIVRRLTDGVESGDILLMHDTTPVAVRVAEGVLKKLARE